MTDTAVIDIDFDDIFFYCFVCGTHLVEINLGWLQCDNENCGEVFLPFIDENNNQCLMQQKTPFS